MSATYEDLEFKTPLEAQWAAFFDLAGWEYRTNPAAVRNVRPDFRVTFKCGHSECGPSHTLLATVLSVESLEMFKGHPAYGRSQEFGVTGASHCDGWAILGQGPSVTQWCMSHGAGGGMDDVPFWVDDAEALWARAGKLVSDQR